MNDLDKARKHLSTALDTAKRAYGESHSDYDAGRCEGLKEAVELVDRQLDRGIER
jgi:hypothetical protein